MPALDFGLMTELEPTDGSQVIPCFPLGGVYVPESKEQVLNIFEPRYRAMYNDILLSGGRRFVVAQARQTEAGQVSLAEVGVVFYLDDLQEVSEQTNDQVKYVCSHSIVGRKRIKRVLNPRAFADRSTYLRVEVEDVVDIDASEDGTSMEERVQNLLADVTSLQRKTKQNVQFVDTSTMNVTRNAFWSTADLWDKYTMRCLEQRQLKFKEDFEATLRGISLNSPGPISADDLPPEVLKDLAVLQQQLKEEVEPMLEQKNTNFQQLIQTDSHIGRLTIFEGMVEKEKNRLAARSALKSIFEE